MPVAPPTIFTFVPIAFAFDAFAFDVLTLDPIEPPKKKRENDKNKVKFERNL